MNEKQLKEFDKQFPSPLWNGGERKYNARPHVVKFIDSLMSEQKRLILEAGKPLMRTVYGKDDWESKMYNQALTDYQDKIKKI